MTSQAIDPNAIIMGSSSRTAKFASHGDRVWGTIMSAKVRQQTDLEGKRKFYDDGEPMLEVVITLLTDLAEGDDDDGMRTVYARGQMLQAIRSAAVKAGSPKGIADGGVLFIQYMSDDQPKKKGHSGAKRYFAKYEIPAHITELPDDTEAGMGDIAPDDLPFVFKPPVAISVCSLDGRAAEVPTWSI